MVGVFLDVPNNVLRTQLANTWKLIITFINIIFLASLIFFSSLLSLLSGILCYILLTSFYNIVLYNLGISEFDYFFKGEKKRTSPKHTSTAVFPLCDRMRRKKEFSPGN